MSHFKTRYGELGTPLLFNKDFNHLQGLDSGAKKWIYIQNALRLAKVGL